MTTTQPDILAALRAPFPPERISWRVGATKADKSQGLALAYIDARDVMHRLDAVCGINWQCEYVPMPNGTCCCRIGVRINGEWFWRSNGALSVPDSDKPDAQEMAEKGSYSDAFKRAAVLWGIAQYLYDLENVWVNLKAQGRSHVIDDKEMPKLAAALKKAASHIAPPPKEPAPSLPEGMTTGEDVENPVTKARTAMHEAADYARVVKLTDLACDRIAAAAKSDTPSPWKHAGQVRDLLHFALLRMKQTATTIPELDSARKRAEQWQKSGRLDADSVLRAIEGIDARIDELQLQPV